MSLSMYSGTHVFPLSMIVDAGKLADVAATAQRLSPGRIPSSLGDFSFLLRRFTDWTRPSHSREGNGVY